MASFSVCFIKRLNGKGQSAELSQVIKAFPAEAAIVAWCSATGVFVAMPVTYSQRLKHLKVDMLSLYHPRVPDLYPKDIDTTTDIRIAQFEESL